MMKFNIFVSYSTHDLPQAKALQKQIENTPIEVFVAKDSISPGEELTSSIREAIEKCDLFVLLWSKNAKDSDWVRQEIGEARGQKKKILPLVLDEGIKLPAFISDLKYIPLFKDLEKGLKEAGQFIENEYRNKKDKNIESLAVMGIGAFLLWILNQR